MSVTGIVIEYNPMHNGHLFHLAQSRVVTNCDYIVGIMSGNFVQRGEPAFINKWARTQMALLGGVDLLIELPLLYSISSAEGFAYGAVSTLNSLGIIDNICFGSESIDMVTLSLVSSILSEEPTAYKNFLQENLKLGFSFPRARQIALTNYIITNNIKNVNSNMIENIISSPNNILGIEYIKALIKISSKITPFAINRISNNYNDAQLTGEISSATSIRNNFYSSDIKLSLPDFALNIINNEIREGRGPLTLKNFSDIILYKLRHYDAYDIENLLDVEEGLHNRIKRAAEDSGDITECINAIKNKRYTNTRIQRILIYALLGITKDLQKKIKSGPEYIRVLGFNSKGQELLNKIKKNCILPIITNPSSKDAQLLKYDILATDTYVLCYSNSKYKTSKQDLKAPPIII